MDKLQLLGLGLISLMISSCGNNSTSSNIFNDAEYVAVLKSGSEEKSKNEIAFSCVDNKGNFKYEDVFGGDGKYIGVPSNFVNGYFTLEFTTNPLGRYINSQSYYPLFKASKHPEIVKGCDNLYSVGCMNDGVIPVAKQGDRISVINGTGKTLFTLDPIDGKEIISCDVTFYDGLLRIENEEHKYGFVDKKGNVIIKPQYFEVYAFSEGKALVAESKEGWIMGKYWAKYSVIDTKGNVVSKWEDCGPIDFNEFPNNYYLVEDWDAIKEGLGRYHDGMLLVENNDRRFLFLDAKGNTKFMTPTEVESVTEYNSKCFVCKLNGEWGVMDFKGKVIIPGQYRNVVILRNGNILCHEHQRYKEIFHLYDSSGREKRNVEYEYIEVYGKFIIGVPQTHKNNRIVHKDIILDNELNPVAEYCRVCNYFLAQDRKVTSNYLEVQKYIKNVSDLVTINGIDKYKLEDSPSNWFDPEEHPRFAGKDTLRTIVNLGGMFNWIKCDAYCDKVALHGPYGSYRWDPDARVQGFVMWSEAPISWDSVNNVKLVKAIQNKGFTLVEDTPDVQTSRLKSSDGKAEIKIKYGNGYLVRIDMYKIP